MILKNDFITSMCSVYMYLKRKKELVDKVAFNVLSGDKDLQNICTNQSEYPISVQQLQKP